MPCARAPWPSSASRSRATFAASLIAGPVLEGVDRRAGIFALTGVLALAAIAVVRFAVPDPGRRDATASVTRAASSRASFRDPQLLRLNYGTFALHAVLMALFTQVPFALRDNGLARERHWIVYLPVLVGLDPGHAAVRASRRPARERGKPLLIGAVAVLLVAQSRLAFSLQSLVALCVELTLFFAALNLLEAILPALVSKCAPREARGAAIGVNSSVQFLGAFAGAAAGGWLSEHAGGASVSSSAWR